MGIFSLLLTGAGFLKSKVVQYGLAIGAVAITVLLILRQARQKGADDVTIKLEAKRAKLEHKARDAATAARSRGTADSMRDGDF